MTTSSPPNGLKRHRSASNAVQQLARQAARDKKLGRFLEQAKAKLQNEGA
jgi:hypothetical protein